MDEFLGRFWWLKSKKVWAFIIGLVSLTAASFQMDVFPYADYTTKIVALIIGFMGSNAVEDGMKARADAKATTTTVSTPGTSDVQVTQPPETQPAPHSPAFRNLGGKP